KAGQRLKTNLALGQVRGDLDEMLGIAPQAIELPDDERVAFPAGPQTVREFGAGRLGAGGMLFIDVATPYSTQGIQLEVERLVTRGNPGIPDQRHTVVLSKPGQDLVSCLTSPVIIG